MKKLSQSTLVVILSLVFTSFTIPATVYICLSPAAKKYHYDRNCRGLKQCTHDIKAVSRGEAEDRGLELCDWED